MIQASKYGLLLALMGILLLPQLASAAPTQGNTYWSDAFADQTGIATLSNVNFSAGNPSG